jgi:hypothetical protein
MSITKASAVAFVMGAAVLMSAPDARAAGMSAADAYSAAQAQCATLVKGQQAFCMQEAYMQYQVNSAKESKKDVTIHHDYDTSNDTPAQAKAKAAYEAATNQCATEVSGQQAFCMEQAHDTYEQSMGWK